jgi:hypothetical protein
MIAIDQVKICKDSGKKFMVDLKNQYGVNALFAYK